METNTLAPNEITEKFSDTGRDSGTEEDMPPQGTDMVLSAAQNGEHDEHEFGGVYMGNTGRQSRSSEATKRLMSTDGEDGEILEDGEIASDEGEAVEDGTGNEDDTKSSPSKKGHKDDRDRHRNKRDRHSKRRRSKEDGHRDKQQKKKRHREYVDYDKTGEDGEQPWSPNERREKGDRKGERSPPAPYHSPSHDSHGEERGKHDKEGGGDKHRRGSGDSRHHGGRDRERTRDKDRNRDSRDRSRDRHDKDKKDKHERGDKDKKDRDRHKESRDKDGSRPYQPSDDYDSPPGIYDSPSDEEFSENRFGNKKPKTLMSLVEGEFMDPALAANENEMDQPLRPKNKKKMQKKKEWQERARQREREREFDEEQPVKKKPLLQTPMEERPVCKFFKEGKCQKGANCLFKHDFKRLELCRFYLKSFCRQEEECPYMHSEFPCKYFHTGSTCYQGDNCKFSHAPLTPDTEEALKNALNDNEYEEYFEGYEGARKYKKKGLLGDQPQMSEEEIQRKLEHMKKIPSIFDIETFAPGDSPSKPKPPQMGQSPSNIRPQGFYQDSNMSPQGGPNMRFNGPPNQGTPPQRPFMQGQGGPRMDGPPGMQGPPMGGPGLMGPGPPPMGPQGPGMQGAPLGPAMNNQGPPMSQAAALVGAILRAAPMLQQYRGPSQQGPPTSMANNMNNDPRFMNQSQGGMGPNPNMLLGQGPNMNQGPPNMNQGPPNMNQGPPNMNQGPPNMNQGPPNMNQGPPNMNQGPPNMNQIPPLMNFGQEGMVNLGPGMQENQGPEGFMPDGSAQQNLNMGGGPPMSRDPRRNMGVQNDPRINREMMDNQKHQDVDMRTAGNVGGPDDMMDIDLRQDVDMRQEECGNKTNPGNTTPQQEWDDDSENRNDDSDIPSHLPPKQREMFLRIKQHTLKMNAQKSDAIKTEQMESASMKDDDKWYSSDEDDEQKPDISNILKSINQNDIKKEPGVGNPPATSVSSINVMQMINAIKGSTPTDDATTAPARPLDPRLRQDPKPKAPYREPAIILSQEGECPWRLIRVLYTKQRMPSNFDIHDLKYKNDPRVQKLLKLQELESGMFIDHSKSKSKSNSSIKKEIPEVSEQKPLNLLDPRAIIPKEIPVPVPRPELAPFVDPRVAKSDNIKSEPHPPRPKDPRMKPGLDMKPNVPLLGTHNLPVKPLDPRLSRQDSNSSSSAMGRVSDPRLARQTSREPEQSMGSMPRVPTPPMDPRQLNRQSSGDPRLQRTETAPVNVNINMNKPFDPRLGRVMDSEIAPPLVQRQLSQPATIAEKDAASSNPNKPKLDYRNDPRFKRKHISESNLPPETLGKRYTGQRKSSTEYSSPLGDEAAKPEESGYNSYNRPRPQVKVPQTSQPSSTAFNDGESVSNQDITTHDILDSIQIMPPPVLEQTPGPDKNLKDIFKTIDPTASPFC